MKKIIAIQGGKASFHDIAARQYYKDEIDVIECKTFEEVCLKVNSGEADHGLLAIENSIAGHILKNYSLIQKYQMVISGETKIRIKQNVMALKGQKIEDLTRVKSHYMALLQCEEFMNQYPHIELEEDYDTADSAKYIQENQAKGVGAIAGELAAKTYGLEILAESVETIKKNFTRFLVLEKRGWSDVNKAECDKATLSFELPHEVGALANILKVIVDYGVNLTMIQSLPIIGKPDEYTFYVDCTWTDFGNWERCKATLRNFVVQPRILGEYKNWEIVYDHFSS